MTDPKDNRQSERVMVALPATISILIPEQTFRPITQNCEVVDISERGAMINVQISPESYTQMLRKTRYCRLEFPDHDELPKKVTGRAVWLQPQGPEENRFYRVGLFFEDCPPEIVSALRTFIRSIKNGKANTTTSDPEHPQDQV